MSTTDELPEAYRAVIPKRYHRALAYKLTMMPAHKRPDALQDAALAALQHKSPTNAAAKAQRARR